MFIELNRNDIPSENKKTAQKLKTGINSETKNQVGTRKRESAPATQQQNTPTSARERLTIEYGNFVPISPPHLKSSPQLKPSPHLRTSTQLNPSPDLKPPPPRRLHKRKITNDNRGREKHERDLQFKELPSQTPSIGGLRKPKQDMSYTVTADIKVSSNTREESPKSWVWHTDD